jgi:hypothetical protein
MDDAGGDGQDSVDERDLDVAVTLGAAFDERQGDEDPFRLDEVRSRGDG